MTKNIKIEKEGEINNMNNRFVQIGGYNVLDCDARSGYSYSNFNNIRELVDLLTGIVYMDFYFNTGAEMGHQVQPMLYDNGTPKHLNKGELLKIKMMIEGIDRSACENGHENYEELIQKKQSNWTLEEIYNKILPDSKDKKAYEIAYMEKLNSN